MKTIKAFATHSQFTTNTENQTHPFGELTTFSRSYEKDIAIFPHDTDKAITLNVFKSLDGRTVTPPNSNMVSLTLDIAQWVYNHVLNKAGEINKQEMLPALLVDFQGRAERFNVGNVVNDGRYHCVEWISWHDPVGNEYRLWFSDAAFRVEYENFTIEIVPPVENLNIFFSTPEAIKEELKRFPIDVLSRKANVKKSDKPVTVFRVDIFDWVSNRPDVPNIPTNWYILIWGDAGDNIDSVKDALRDYILTHSASQHNEQAWKRIFPDIFNRSEFVIVPQWNVFSNENKVREQASLYSPFSNLKDLTKKYVKPFVPNYKATHVDEHTQIVGLYYRAIVGYVIGSEENRDNKYKLQDIFPDYIDVSSTSTDFNYMSKNTQDFSIALQKMLAFAETMTEFTELPRDSDGEKLFTRVKRGEHVYLVYKHGNFNFLVLSKASLIAQFNQ